MQRSNGTDLVRKAKFEFVTIQNIVAEKKCEKIGNSRETEFQSLVKNLTFEKFKLQKVR